MSLLSAIGGLVGLAFGGPMGAALGSGIGTLASVADTRKTHEPLRPYTPGRTPAEKRERTVVRGFLTSAHPIRLYLNSRRPKPP